MFALKNTASLASFSSNKNTLLKFNHNKIVQTSSSSSSSSSLTTTSRRRRTTFASVGNNNLQSKHLPGKLILQGENNLEITDAIRQYVEDKIIKACVNVDQRDAREIDVRCSSRGGADKQKTKGAHLCTTKVTVLTRNGQIEVSEEHEDLYASIDLTADALKRQMRKFSEKHAGNAKGSKDEVISMVAAGNDDDDAADDVPPAA